MKDLVTPLLHSFVDRKMAAGASCLVTTGGKEAYFGCCGYADIEQRKPFVRDTLLHIYSMTKIVTAAAIMTLVDSGVLSLTDPVARFIPEFADAQVCEEQDGKAVLVPARRPLTIFDLLTMTSGIPYPDVGGTPAREAVAARYAEVNRLAAGKALAGDPMDTLTFVKELARCPLCFHPGDSWLYGLSCDVLGAVIVAITGMSLGDYMHKKIFFPLDMKDTAFRMPEEKADRLATIYTDGPRGVVPRTSRAPFEMVDNKKIEAGGAGLISTVDDYTRFALMLMNGGILDGECVLSADSVRAMSRNHLDDRQLQAFGMPNNKGYGYGLAMRVMLDPDKSDYREGIGAFGWNGAAGTTVRIDPVLRRTVVFGIQRMPANHPDYLPALLKAVQEMIVE